MEKLFRRKQRAARFIFVNTCTGLGLANPNTKELTAIPLDVWASTCNCLLEDTEVEKDKRNGGIMLHSQEILWAEK